MQGLVSELIQSILDVPGAFADVAASDPLSAVLLLTGAALIGFASAVMGYLSLGAAVDFVMPS